MTFYNVVSVVLQTYRPIHTCPMYKANVKQCVCKCMAGLCLRPANKRRRYKVTPSLIGWAQTQNQSWNVSLLTWLVSNKQRWLKHVVLETACAQRAPKTVSIVDCLVNLLSNELYQCPDNIRKVHLVGFLNVLASSVLEGIYLRHFRELCSRFNSLRPRDVNKQGHHWFR